MKNETTIGVTGEGLDRFSDDELEEELRRRGKEILTQERRCAGCGRYNARYVAYSSWMPQWHCNGCNRPENDCTCRR